MATKKAIKNPASKPAAPVKAAAKSTSKPAVKTAPKAAAKAAPKAAAKPSAYAAAGVNIALGDKVKHGLKQTLKSASRPEVLAAVGGFGGLFDLSKLNYKHPVLVSSVDGVGTKLKLAFETGNHGCVGQDIVNHCVNDIAVMGASAWENSTPLFSTSSSQG